MEFRAVIRPALAMMFCMLLPCVACAAATAPRDEPGTVCSVQFENDFFGGGTDRHFTHGTAINCLTKPIPWMTAAAAGIPWFEALEVRKEVVEARASITVGQSMYTPEDISRRDLIEDDRPYAGWLYLGLGVVVNEGDKRYDRLELDVGAIGPASYAGAVQKTWHSLLGLRRPNGWKHQLKDEPGIVLFYEHARRVAQQDVIRGIDFDAIFHLGGSLGNVFTYANAGFTLRVGSALDKDFGPPRIRPSLPGSGYFVGRKGFNWYIFAGTEGRAVARNIFLDGNTFTDSHSVDKKLLVGDFQAGLALQVYGMRVTYTQILRTTEFYGQRSPDRFGALSIAYQF